MRRWLLRLLVLLAGVVLGLPGLVRAQGKLTPSQESWLRQVYFGQTNLWNTAYVNSTNWVAWRQVNSNNVQIMTVFMSNYPGLSNVLGRTGVWDNAWVSWTSSPAYMISGADTTRWNNAVMATTNPRAGIWALVPGGGLGMAPYPIEPAAGFFKVDTNYQVVVSSNWWTDAWWATNSSGQIVMRALP